MSAPIVVASNRGPVAFDEKGRMRRGAGGLAASLTGALRGRDATWVAAPISATDRAHVGLIPGKDDRPPVRLLDIPPDTYDAYYNQLANRILWFVHHYLFNPPRTPVFDQADADAWDSFCEVNRLFAHAIAEEAAPGGVVFVQDYHLSLVAGTLRALRPDLAVAHFWHISFADPDYLSVLPDVWNRALLEGMLGADVIGFNAGRWARAFRASCRQTLGVTGQSQRVTREGHGTALTVCPVGADVEGLRSAASSREVRSQREELEEWAAGRRIILRVDRADPSKNILRGLLAVEAALERSRAELDHTVHLALLTPSRLGVPEYDAYVRECVWEADRINSRFGTEAIRLEIEDNLPRVLAAYGIYDVILVNPLFDGMNLVAHESAVLNERRGVLVLSRNAGAWEWLGDAALGVNPFDVRETTDAIVEALSMPQGERVRRAAQLRRSTRRHPPERWLDAQLRHLGR